MLQVAIIPECSESPEITQDYSRLLGIAWDCTGGRPERSRLRGVAKRYSGFFAT